MRRPLGLAAGLVLGLTAAGPAPLTGQGAEERASACVSAGGGAVECAAAAVSVRRVVAHTGLMASPGAEIPGEGSTLGRRLGGAPRTTLWLRGGVQPFALPDPADPASEDAAASWTPTLQAGVGLGVFDGFRLLPTVGGLLSLDVFGHASFLFLSDANGFDGRADVWSVGARVGLLRESFTLPGVTLSLSRRFSGDVLLGDTDAGDAIEVRSDPALTSLRLTVSKDLFALGVLAGVGWDDFSSDTELVVPDGLGGVLVSSGPLDGRRRLFFGSVTRQLGILAWLTVEGGWGSGFDAPPGYVSDGFDPQRSSFFGSVSLLLKL